MVILPSVSLSCSAAGSKGNSGGIDGGGISSASQQQPAGSSMGTVAGGGSLFAGVYKSVCIFICFRSLSVLFVAVFFHLGE